MPLANANVFLKTITTRPGVYQMMDKHHKILYVGKARNLKRRLASYFRKDIKDSKTAALMSQVDSIITIVTQTENEALILENNLIKKHLPRYNILFRDDKSYPYIYVSNDEFPRITLYRGAKKQKGQYFGPYPSVKAAKYTLKTLQKLFHIRPCKNTFFKSRTRPCLLYQIKRCSAPCVNLTTKNDYANELQQAILFLQGKSDIIIRRLEKQMEQASRQQKYEQAAQHRDQIQQLREIQSQQHVSSNSQDTDIIVVIEKNGIICIYVLLIRYGRIIGNKTFFPKVTIDHSLQDVLTTFLTQYYLNTANEIPQTIIINLKLANQKIIQDVLATEKQKNIILQNNVRGEKKQWLNMAITNAQQTLHAHILTKANLLQRFQALQKALNLPTLPEKIACFDVSHTMGEATVAACVVFNLDGSIKNEYRRFNINNITPGDDLAAMKQAVNRHFARLCKAKAKLPNILLIDGGKTQLKQAEQVLNELKIKTVTLIAVAKGATRKPGYETLHLPKYKNPISLTEDDPALHLIQQIRDEAHRFAITGHKKRREKSRKQSLLENIPGIGMHKRQTLLKHFGGMQGILKASITDLTKVAGISQKLAQIIYQFLH